jgi:hypothetical protein
MQGNLNQFNQISNSMLNVQPEGKDLWTTYTPHRQTYKALPRPTFGKSEFHPPDSCVQAKIKAGSTND